MGVHGRAQQRHRRAVPGAAAGAHPRHAHDWRPPGRQSGAASAFTGLTRSRILDTRAGAGGFGNLGANHAIAVQVAGQGGVPALNTTGQAAAVVINVTVTGATAGSYLTVYPDGTPRPLA